MFSSVSRRLTTNPTALKTIMIPLASSPQRIFFSCINVDITSEKVRRGSRDGGSGKSQGAGFALPWGKSLGATGAGCLGGSCLATVGTLDSCGGIGT